MKIDSITSSDLYDRNYITQIQCVSARVKVGDYKSGQKINYGLYKSDDSGKFQLVETGVLPYSSSEKPYVVNYCDENLDDAYDDSYIGKYILNPNSVNQDIKFRLVFDGIDLDGSEASFASGVEFNLNVKDADVSKVMATGSVKYPNLFSLTSPKILNLTTRTGDDKSQKHVFRKTFIVSDITVNAKISSIISTDTNHQTIQMQPNTGIDDHDNEEIYDKYYIQHLTNPVTGEKYDVSMSKAITEDTDLEKTGVCYSSVIHDSIYSICYQYKTSMGVSFANYVLNVLPASKFCRPFKNNGDYIGYHITRNFYKPPTVSYNYKNGYGAMSCSATNDVTRVSDRIYPTGAYVSTCPRLYSYKAKGPAGNMNTMLHASCLNDYAKIFINDINLDVVNDKFGRVDFLNEQGTLVAH